MCHDFALLILIAAQGYFQFDDLRFLALPQNRQHHLISGSIPMNGSGKVVRRVNGPAIHGEYDVALFDAGIVRRVTAVHI